MRGVMRDPSARKKPERHSGPPCLHYPHKYKTEAAHQGKLASRRRSHQRMQKSSLDYRLRAILRTIFQRCYDPGHTSYKWYGGRGIRTTLTFKQLKTLWLRDGADRMRKPSIDRNHRDDNYEFSKCKFMELAANVRKGTCKAAREAIRRQPGAA